MAKWAGLACALWLASAAAADRVNPFAQPERNKTPQARETGVATARPELRGVIAAGERSLANLDGKLLAIGDEASGYRLARVGETSATFWFEDEEVTLHLTEPEEEPDD